MKITKISRQKRDDRYNLYAGDEFLVGVSGETLLESGLGVGDEISEEQVRSLRVRDGASRTLAKAYDYLSRRQHSEAELCRKLAQKEYPAIEEAVHRLKKYGYLDDEKFAVTWVAERSNTRGPHLLRRELREKGIDEEIIDRALGENQENIREIAEKRYGRLQDLPWETVYSRLGGYLLRRGYELDEVRTVLAEYKERHLAKA